MANENPMSVSPATMTIPCGYLNRPMVGKIEELYSANNNLLYTKLSPYMDQSSNTDLIKFGAREPYISFNPNTGGTGVNSWKKYDSQAFPLASGIEDTERITLFLASSKGILFLAAQSIMQRFNAFNETRTYNVLSSLSATARAATLFATPMPLRHVEGGLLGMFAGLVGINLSQGQPILGTTGNISAASQPDGYKGLMRYATGQRALSEFEKKTNYISSVGNSTFSVGGILGVIMGLSNTISTPKNSTTKATYRPDEEAYLSYLITMGSKKYIGNMPMYKPAALNFKLSQRYFNSLDETSSPFDITKGSYKYVINNSNISPDYITQTITATPTSKNLFRDVNDITANINDLDKTGLELVDGITKYSPKNIFNQNISSLGSSKSENSKIIATQLQNIISTSPLNQSYAIKSSAFVDLKYTDLVNSRNRTPGLGNMPANNYTSGSYFNSSDILESRQGKGFGGAGYPDKVNLLTVLSSSQFIGTGEGTYYNKSNPIDQIAFYFYDMVNDRYIPFRATVKGVSEQAQANWGDVKYIGRMDSLYNYNGFTRNLSFGFKVVANSIQELMPMWQRINYMMTCVKPSKYTNYFTPSVLNGAQGLTSVFPIPPMMQITIGDLYKNQPIIIRSINMTIDDDALWETTSELENQINPWSYLQTGTNSAQSVDLTSQGYGFESTNGLIAWKNSLGKVGQFPRECDLSIESYILEKERPQMGYNSFGDYLSALAYPYGFSKAIRVGNT